jgi:hypothetical protein
MSKVEVHASQYGHGDIISSDISTFSPTTAMLLDPPQYQYFEVLGQQIGLIGCRLLLKEEEEGTHQFEDCRSSTSTPCVAIFAVVRTVVIRLQLNILVSLMASIHFSTMFVTIFAVARTIL